MDTDRRARSGNRRLHRTFDPATRKPLGLTLAAQSKVASAIGKDSSPTFDFWCEPADVEYWLAGSMPVILVVSHPPSDEAYWVSVKDYFKGWTLGNPTAVTFKKSEQRFNKDSFRALAAIAAPKAGLYLAPPRKSERLHSNLLRIGAFPKQIYFADTECRWPSDVWALLRKSHHEPDGGWVLKGKRFISFHDLSDEPWTTVCDQGTVESFLTSDWSESSYPERQHLFVQLLNQTLRAQRTTAAFSTPWDSPAIHRRLITTTSWATGRRCGIARCEWNVRISRRAQSGGCGWSHSKPQRMAGRSDQL